MIEIDELPLTIVGGESVTSLEGVSSKTVMGVSSFGFGGTNAHVVLRGSGQGAPTAKAGASEKVEGGWHVVVASGKSEKEALANGGAIGEWLVS